MKNFINFVPNVSGTRRSLNLHLAHTHTHTHTQRASQRKNWFLPLIFFLMLSPTFVFGQDQIFFSEDWTQDGGEAALFYKNSSVTDDLGFVYTVGSSINSNFNHDIIVQKFDPDGGLVWQELYNGAANLDDMGADIFVDDNYEVYVTGTSNEVLANDLDLIVLKFKSNGFLDWTFSYDNGGNPTPKDAGIAIVGDNNGGVYVAGSSFGSNTLADYVTLKLNSSNGVQIWESRYNYANLFDVPSKIELNGSELFVSGASQINANSWELATLVYHTSSGVQLAEERSQGSSTNGINEVTDLATDANGNLYLTGLMYNQNTGTDISIYKLDDQLNVIWEVQHDGHGLDDKGNGIKVDILGNVYVAGFVTTPNEGKNYSLLKFNSSGVLQWSREFNGEANLDDEAIQLVIASNQDVFVTGSARNYNNADIQTLGYKPNGEIFTQAIFEGVNDLDDQPTGIAVDLSGSLIVAGRMGEANGNYRNIIIKYSLYLKPFSPVLVNGEPSHNANEVLIRFDRSAVNYAAIDRKGFIAGRLSDFVKPNVISLMDVKLKMNVSSLRTFKIYKSRTTADTLSINRLGDTIKVQDFWATLSVIIPNSSNVNDFVDDLNELKQIIHYAEPNHIYQFLGVPNDPLYANTNLSGQTGLHDPVYGINVEGAWDQGAFGKDFVKVGVYDTGIHYYHEDYGDGTWYGSKIEDGMNYHSGIHPQILSNPDKSLMGHGTMVAGIIGALRNNNKGAAGIAGGDGLGNTGASLYTFSINNDDDGLLLAASTIAEAIEEGSGEHPTSGKNYNIDIQSFSFGSKTNYNINLRNTILKSYRNNVIMVAANGKDGGSLAWYPAGHHDEWIMSTGGNTFNGRRDLDSPYNNPDFLAPSVSGSWQAPKHNDNSGYRSGNGTSFSAPHVSGVAALMLGRHDPSTDIDYHNVLAPEDVEIILQKTATPVTGDDQGGFNLPVPNIYAGHGRINAGEAINQISLPYSIKHYDLTGNTFQATLHASNQNINFPEGIPGVITAPGNYDIGLTDVYKLTATFNLPIYTNHTILDIWVRNSSSDLYGLTNDLYDQHWSGVEIESLNQNIITVSGYLYETKILHDGTSNVAFLKYFPVDRLSNVKFSISVHMVENKLGLNNEDIMGNVTLYPNPTKDELNFKVDLNSNGLKLEVFDITGKKVVSSEYLNIYNKKYENSIDVSNLTNGLYFCKFTSGDNQVTRKFIKE